MQNNDKGIISLDHSVKVTVAFYHQCLNRNYRYIDWYIDLINIATLICIIDNVYIYIYIYMLVTYIIDWLKYEDYDGKLVRFYQNLFDTIHYLQEKKNTFPIIIVY